MAAFEHGYAVLVGVDENQVVEWSLPPVARDIAALEQVLTHPERCAYPPGQVKTITGTQATRQGILDGLDWLREQVQGDTSSNVTAILHYSGHGWRDESVKPPAFYLIPYDVRREGLRSRALRAEDFAEAVRSLNPRRLLVILDCCHAGGMNVRDILPGGSFLETALPPALLMGGEPTIPAAQGLSGLAALELGQGRAVLSSSQGEQPSYNRRDGKMGIFTYHLIEALTGHAQPQAGATEVLVSDVMGYVWRRVPHSAQADWGQDQQPDYQVSGNFPVALLLGGKGLGLGQALTDPLEALPTRLPGRSFTVNTGGGDYTGQTKIVYGDEVRGDKVGGDKLVVGDVSGTGIAIGQNAQANVTAGVSSANLDRLFEPVFLALQLVSPGKRAEAVEKARALQKEVARGEQADDSRMARWLDELVTLVPEAAGAVTNVFLSPNLAAVPGPVTQFLLEKIRAGGDER